MNYDEIEKLMVKLNKLKSYMEEVASIDTAYNNEYNPNDIIQGKMHNHSGCSAFTVQKMFGGQIVSMKGHYWNKFDYHQFDLTNANERLKPRYSVHRDCPPRKSTNERFQKFYNRVVSLLHEQWMHTW